MQWVYSVGYCKEYEKEDWEQIKTLGIFSSRKKAQEALKKYKELPGFKEATEEELFIAREKVGLSFWDGGYSTVGEIMSSLYGTTVTEEEVEEEYIIDVPYWARNKRSKEGETIEMFAKRLIEAQYPQESYPTGPSSEFYQIKRVRELREISKLSNKP